MTAYTITSNKTTAQSPNLIGDDTETISSGVNWSFAGPLITWGLGTGQAAAGVVVTNSGTMAATTTRVFDTTATAATSKVSFGLTNTATGVISAFTDVMRVRAGLFGGTIAVDNAGLIAAGAASRGINEQEYVGLGRFAVVNRAGAIIQASDDVLRITTGTAGSDTTANAGFGGSVSIDNFGTIRSTGTAGTGAGSGQALDFNDINSTVTGGVVIINEAGGLISATDNDAIRPGNNGTVSNFGVISAGNIAPAKDVTVQAGAGGISASVNETITIINALGGTISGAKSGVFGSRGTITTVGTVVTNTQLSRVIVTNNGTIIGLDGKAVGADYGSVTNTGLISGRFDSVNYARGDGDGVDINYTGTITNLLGGTIEGLGSIGVDDNGRSNIADGISIGGGTVDNFGRISSAGNGVTVNNDSNTDGSRSGNVALQLTNAVGGVITASGGYAIRSENKSGTQQTGNFADDVVVNRGTIISTGTIPNFSNTVLLRDPGTGTMIADVNTVGTVDGVAYTAANAGSTRFIIGDGSAIQLGEGNDSLQNFGTIIATDGLAINLEGGDDTLGLFAGNAITGQINGGTGTDTLNLGVNGAATVGTITNVINFETLNVGTGSWTIADAQTYTSGITISAGRLELAVALGAGTGPITFANGANAALQIDGTVVPSATITGFQAGDVIDLRGLAFVSGQMSAVFNNGTLVVSNGTASQALKLAASSVTTYSTQNDGAGGTAVACFAEGTRLATMDGPVAVEALAVGQRVRTAGGGERVVKWIGHRQLACRRHKRPHDVWPVRVAPDAFGAGMPHTTLWLSPDHAVLIDGVLIPVRYLINDATITQVMRDVITYWHVELDTHDVMLAEGLACESYLDTGNRGAFANGGGAAQLHPDFARAEVARAIWATDACAELVTDGVELEAARSYLLERAGILGHVMTREAGLHVLADGVTVQAGQDGSRYCFAVSGAGTIYVASRGAVPAHLCDVGEDHRRLGVAVARIWLDGEAVALDDARLGSGWHAVEGPELRWTDGRGEIAAAGAGVLEIELAMTARYWDEGRGDVQLLDAVA